MNHLMKDRMKFRLKVILPSSPSRLIIFVVLTIAIYVGDKILFDENDLLDRLKDDFDSQAEFHCHLIGLGGRRRSSSMHLTPPEPSFIKQNYYT